MPSAIWPRCMKRAGSPPQLCPCLAWYKKAAAQGHAHAQMKLGRLYEHGWGAPKDLVEACAWYWTASEGGNARAREALARWSNSCPRPRWLKRAIARRTSRSRSSYERSRTVISRWLKWVRLGWLCYGAVRLPPSCLSAPNNNAQQIKRVAVQGFSDAPGQQGSGPRWRSL